MNLVTDFRTSDVILNDPIQLVGIIRTDRKLFYEL